MLSRIFVRPDKAPDQSGQPYRDRADNADVDNPEPLIFRTLEGQTYRRDKDQGGD